MYTEENEFDYENYDNYEENNNNQNKGINKNLITKIILITICLIIIIFLVFKIKNLGSNNNNNNNNNSKTPVVVFNDNMELLRSKGEEYFFANKNFPKELKEEKVITVKELKEKGLITDIYDYDGSKCGYNTSYVSVVKNKSDYLMQINLVCSSMEDSVSYYYDNDFKCLTCNGEDYTPDIDDNNNNDNNNNNTDNDNKDTKDDNNNNNNNSFVCNNTWGNWTTEYKNDPSLEFEKRILIKAYKVNKTYGEWSQPVKEKPTASNTLEVKEEQKNETTTEYTDWSSKSTSKPAAKEGREIDTQIVKKSYKEKSCTTGENYTKTVKSRDPKALYCKPINNTGTNKGNSYYYTCTYKGEETCKTITKYKNITYYSYRDKVEKEITTTYYQTRTVSENTVYTDYILEKDIPSGYIKLSGSEITQYRYRQVCSK